LSEFQEFVKDYLHEDEDFGLIPGTPKKTLYKPGADKLCELYGLSDSYSILSKVEDWDRGLFDYVIECSLVHRQTGQLVSSGLGSCSTFESKYRWRNATRKCPSCGKDAIIKGKQEYGGGWLCFKKKDGCGAKFPDGDKSIEGQEVGRLENPDICDQKNTVLKMAKKRAKIDATLSATRSSGVFTQDIEDFPHGDVNGDTPPKEPTATDEKKMQEQIEEKGGLRTLIGTVTQKAKGSGDMVMCHVRTEAGDDVLLRADASFDKRLVVNGPIRAKAKRLPTDGDIRMYNLLDLDSDLTGVLKDSVVAAQGKLDQKRATASQDDPKPLTPKAEPIVMPRASQAQQSANPDADEPPQGELAKMRMSKPVSKGEEITIHTARREAHIPDPEYYRILGRHGAEHAKQLTKADFAGALQEIKEFGKLGV
jgi:hypothetical protein